MSAAVVAIASLPFPPLLIPGATGRPVPEVERLRAACLEAIEQVLDADPTSFVLVAPEFTPQGRVPLTPLAERVGRSLLAEAGVAVDIGALRIPAQASSAEAAELGRALIRPGGQYDVGRLGVVVLADGSACRTLKAPGYFDDRAAPFDDAVLAALRKPDPAALLDLDGELAGELLVAGWASWQVLAGLLTALDETGAPTIVAREHYVDDPFGVLYPVFSYRTSG